MDMVLKQSGNNIGLYIDKKLATIFENKSIEQAADWIRKNLRGIKIYVAK